jgi:PilZ domain
MNGEPGEDYPERMTPVDVLAASRGDALVSFVEAVDEAELVLTVGNDRGGRPVRLDPGERLELVWRGPSGLRALPAELVEVQTAGQPTWRIRAAGPATRGQRRAAVRAPLAFRIHLGPENGGFDGQTVDVSEGGFRCLLAPRANPDAATAAPDGAGDASTNAATVSPATKTPEVGDVVPVTLWFDDHDHVSSKAEVVRRHDRSDQRDEMSLRFIGLPERMEDLIRRHVFAGLRDLRARGVL